MMVNKNQFYVIDYSPDGKKLPLYIDKVFTPELPYFDIFIAPPKQNEFAKAYVLDTSVQEIEGDYFVEDDIASERLVQLCRSMNINFISIPLEIKSREVHCNYNLFYLADYISIIDTEKSIYEISKDLETGRLNTPDEMGLDKVYYENITRFIVKDNIDKDLFFCKDIIKHVCSENFKETFERNKLSGVSFTPINNEYTFDAWEGM